MTCKICSIPNEDIFKLPKCGHSICFLCICNHFGEMKSARIGCPVKDCTKFIPDSIIRKCLSNKKLELYDSLCLAPNTVKCLIKDCNYFVAYEQNDEHFTCPVCKQPNCLKCKQLHAENVSCPIGIDLNITKYENDASKYLTIIRKADLLNESNKFVLIPNPESFECPICASFILPRCGVSLRNCMDQFCRNCLNESFLDTDHIKNMSCPIKECSRPLTEGECVELITQEKFQTLCLNLVKPRMYNCQTPECRGMWDFATYTGMHKCELCKKLNCAACLDTHEGKTCEQFRLTPRYIDAAKFRKELEARKKITCQNCKAIIIKNKGCNALRCPNCRLQVCAYSGLEVGANGCKCTNSKRCVEGCHPGCIPEGETPYEKRLAEYFWAN